MATVRDQLDFEALPAETQELARRVLEAPVGADPGTIEAYRRGWDDALDEAEFTRPMVPDASHIVRRLAPPVTSGQVQPA